MFPQMADIVKPGKVGSAEVEIFEISKAEAEVTAFRAMVTGRLEEFCPPGRYARLYVGGQIMMSDTMMERRSNEILIEEARGRVLVGGLGLGMLVHGLVKVAGVELDVRAHVLCHL